MCDVFMMSISASLSVLSMMEFPLTFGDFKFRRDYFKSLWFWLRFAVLSATTVFFPSCFDTAFLLNISFKQFLYKLFNVSSLGKLPWLKFRRCEFKRLYVVF